MTFDAKSYDRYPLMPIGYQPGNHRDEIAKYANKNTEDYQAALSTLFYLMHERQDYALARTWGSQFLRNVSDERCKLLFEAHSAVLYADPTVPQLINIATQSYTSALKYYDLYKKDVNTPGVLRPEDFALIERLFSQYNHVVEKNYEETLRWLELAQHTLEQCEDATSENYEYSLENGIVTGCMSRAFREFSKISNSQYMQKMDLVLETRVAANDAAQNGLKKLAAQTKRLTEVHEIEARYHLEKSEWNFFNACENHDEALASKLSFFATDAMGPHHPSVITEYFTRQSLMIQSDDVEEMHKIVAFMEEALTSYEGPNVPASYSKVKDHINHSISEGKDWLSKKTMVTEQSSHPIDWISKTYVPFKMMETKQYTVGHLKDAADVNAAKPGTLRRCKSM